MATTIESTLVSDHGQVPTGRARWSRLAALGFALAAAAPVVMLVAALLWGLDVGDDLPFFLGTAVVGAVAALLVRSRGTWRKVVGVVAGIALVFPLFWTAFGLTNPASVFDFVPGVLLLPGVLLGAGAGVAAVRAERRHDLVPAPGPRELRVMYGVVGVAGALVVLSVALTVTGRETVGDDVAIDAVVELTDFEFDDETYAFEAGSQLLVRNKDPFMHTFTVDALGIDVTLNPGSEKLVTIPEQPGSFVLYCEPHTGSPDDPADDDMAALIEVR